MNGLELLQEVMRCDFQVVLDIGAGDGKHARRFRDAGKTVLTCDLRDGIDYMDYQVPEPVDLIWCCHVLEHQRNPGLFLDKIHADLREDGFLAITAPPSKPQLAGGHVTIWTEATLLYQLVLAGFDCRNARVWRYGYNISCLVRNRTVRLEGLAMDGVDKDAILACLPKEGNWL